MGVKIREKVKGSGVWWVFVNHKGQRASSSVGSEKAAIRTKEDFEARLKLGLELFPEKKTEPAVTLESYYRKFEHTYLRSACRESTQERYDQCFRLYILPRFGVCGLGEIKRDEVKDFLAGLVEKGLARHSIANITRNFSAVMNHAIEDNLLTDNPAHRLGKFFKAAHVLHDEINPLTPDEVPVLLAVAQERDGRRRKGNPEYCPLFLCAIHTGMRAGDLAGFKWTDIDWKKKFIIVRRSIGRNRRIYRTKTDRIRRVDMSDALAEELTAYRKRRLEEALASGKNETSEWVFASGEGTPLDMHHVERRELELERCLAAAGIRKIRFHDLRHTCASLLLQNGESPVYVKDQLGHSSIKVTVDIYGHLIPGVNREAVNRLPGLKSAPQAHPADLVPVSGGRYRI